MLISKLQLLVCTLYYLKPIQFIYRGKFFLRRLFPQKKVWHVDRSMESQILIWEDSIYFPKYLADEYTFTFLNLSHSFPNRIDWNWLGHGKLWCYNLNYFEFLNQKNVNKSLGKKLIDDYINQISFATIGLEPYPLSLRCLNWIRFFIKYKLKDKKCDAILFQQLELLVRKLEYHLLGNHLLENGFALLFGAYYFDNERFYRQAKRILLPELKEQTLEDGGNFELSPMYHCTILLRILDSYNLVKNNVLFSRELLPVFEKYSLKMLGWLGAIVFRNGDIPLFNDAAFQSAPSSLLLFDYAKRLGIVYEVGDLGESGYRKIINSKFEMVMDAAKVGPDYQPGHAHADTFNFELHVNGRPVIVDTGTSTYEVNKNRFYERSTEAHNTVVVNGRNSSEVWSGHRVGRRAYVTILEDDNHKLVAYHDGYKSKGIKHIRSFEMINEKIVITDNINSDAVAYLHFHPAERVELESEKVIVGKDYRIECEGAVSIKLLNSYYAPEFNKQVSSVKAEIHFKNRLYTIFK